MKRNILFLFLLCLLPVFVFAQTSWKGFYQAQFFDVLGDVKVVEAEFEIQEDNQVSGKLKIGDQMLELKGEVESTGKFEARTLPVRGVITIVKGKLPSGNNPGKVSLIERTEKREKGSKSVFKSELTGIIKHLAPETVTELKDAAIKDNGKTELWFQHPNPLFGKEWTDYPAIVAVKKTGSTTAFEMEMKSKTGEDVRRFAFRILVREDNQKLWTVREIGIVSYGESKKTVEGKKDINFFNASGASILGGQIEIISENDRGMVFKITNLRLKQVTEDNILQINGYIHAVKSNDP